MIQVDITGGIRGSCLGLPSFRDAVRAPLLSVLHLVFAVLC